MKHSLLFTAPLLLATALPAATAAPIRVLHSFAGGLYDGVTPYGGVVQIGSDLFGTTSRGEGGDSSGAVLFRMDQDGNNYQVLHRFTRYNFDGYNLSGDLAVSGTTLFGTTAAGGAYDRGTVFRINADGTGYQTLHSFAGGVADGAEIVDGLVLSGSTLYGTTYDGGASARGTVFKIDTDGFGYQVLHSFNGAGGRPSAGLTLDGSTLYGTITTGGDSTVGKLFKLNTDGRGYQEIYEFGTGPSNGTRPEGDLALVGSTLFGTTYFGGTFEHGTVFKVNTDGSGFQLLHSFREASDGFSPSAGVVVSGTSIYGTAQGGILGRGTVFRLGTDGTGFRALHAFSNAPIEEGAGPSSRLTLAGSTLFGTTRSGGAVNVGTVFALPLPETRASSSFDEPPLGTASFSPGLAERELGFATAQASTGGANPLVGVAAAGSRRLLTHRSARATTTFDDVELQDWTNVEVSMELAVANTTYEVGDFLSIYVTNGNQLITLYDQAAAAGADGLDDLAGEGFVPLMAAIPPEWTTLRLIIDSSSNSSTGAERFDFDDIVFSGTPIPEPATGLLASLGAAVMALLCRSWVGTRSSCIAVLVRRG